MHTTTTKRPMDQTTKEVIAQCIVNIQLLHPNWKISDDTIEQVINLWHYSLKGYQPQLVKKASLEVASRLQYTPKLSDILNYLQHNENPQMMIEDKTSLQSYLKSMNEEQLESYLERRNNIAKGIMVDNPNQYEITEAEKLKECYALIGRTYE